MPGLSRGNHGCGRTVTIPKAVLPCLHSEPPGVATIRRFGSPDADIRSRLFFVLTTRPQLGRIVVSTCREIFPPTGSLPSLFQTRTL